MDTLPTINLGAEIEALQHGIAQVNVGSDKPFLSINKQHIWTIRKPGGEREAVPDDCLFAARVDQPDCFLKEWCAGNVGAAMQQPLSQGLLVPSMIECELNQEHSTHKISQGLAIDMACVAGPLTGMVLRYETDAKNGIAAIKQLVTEFMIIARRNPSPMIPIISLGVDISHMPGYGETHKPVLKVDYWDTAELDETRRRMNGNERQEKNVVDESAPPPSVRSPQLTKDGGPNGCLLYTPPTPRN